MKHFPVYHAIAIAALLVSIFLVLKYLPEALRESAANKVQKAEPPVAKNLKEVVATFRFSAKPKRILLTNEENEVLFESEEISFDYDLSVNPVFISIDDSDQSKLRLLVEWDTPPDNFYFFTLELNGGFEHCFGTHTMTTDITEDIFFQW